MAMEQVNLQELQRLNDAITVTFDAIRRVAPQLQALQQMTQMQVPFGMQNPWQQPYGYGVNQQQLLPLVHQLLQQLTQQPYGVYNQWQQQPYTQWQQQPYGIGQTTGQIPFGGIPFQGMSSPFQSQRIF